jgi:hypothetical protein
MNKVTVLIEDNYDEGIEIRRLDGLLLDENFALVVMDYGNALRIIPVKATIKADEYDYISGTMYKHVFIFDDKPDDDILDQVTKMSAVEFLRSIAHQRNWDAF